MSPTETVLRIIAYLRSRKGFDSWWSEQSPTDQTDVSAALIDYVQEACDAYVRQATDRDNKP